MGNMMYSVKRYYEGTENYPPSDEPVEYLHDPMLGFPNGRKQREMVASFEEMEHWGIAPYFRDFCAHHYLDYLKCEQRHWPVVRYHCGNLMHEWYACEYKDELIRLMEYERERRLIQRDKRIAAKEAA